MIKPFNKREKEKTEAGLFSRMREGLAKTRSGFTGRLDRLLLGKKEINEAASSDDNSSKIGTILFVSRSDKISTAISGFISGCDLGLTGGIATGLRPSQ